MNSRNSIPRSFNLKRLLITATSACLVVGLAAPVAVAQHRGQPVKASAQGNSEVAWKAPARRRVIVKPNVNPLQRGVVAPRRRSVGPNLVYRPYGPTIYGYGFHYTDAEAARWIAFTAITIKILDMMEEDQVRYHEQAQIEATSASIGEAIVWESGGASGSVTPLREGNDANGYTCREFEQIVTIEGQQETAFATACLNVDGSWRIVQ